MALSIASLRREMCLAHRLTAHFGMDDLTWNHISCRTTGTDFLVTPGSIMYPEIMPDDLTLGSEAVNETGFIIHEALYEARPDVMAIVHTHTPAIMAVSCLEGGLQCITQDGAAFYERVAYHDWEGVSTDGDEKARLGRDMGPSPYHTLIMRNHGACTVGATLGEAWVRMYYLDRICQVQLDLMRATAGAEAAGGAASGAGRGDPICRPTHDMLVHARAQYDKEFVPGVHEWPSLLKMGRRLFPDVEAAPASDQAGQKSKL